MKCDLKCRRLTLIFWCCVSFLCCCYEFQYLIWPEHGHPLLYVELPGGGQGPGHVPPPDVPGVGDPECGHLAPGAVCQGHHQGGGGDLGPHRAVPGPRAAKKLDSHILNCPIYLVSQGPTYSLVVIFEISTCTSLPATLWRIHETSRDVHPQCYLNSDGEPDTQSNIWGVEVHCAAVDVNLPSKGVLRPLCLERGSCDKCQASFKQNSAYFDFVSLVLPTNMRILTDPNMMLSQSTQTIMTDQNCSAGWVIQFGL